MEVWCYKFTYIMSSQSIVRSHSKCYNVTYQADGEVTDVDVTR